MKNKPSQPIIKQLTARIVKSYQPEKIILFGSAAVGKIHEDSDLDLVIIKKTQKRFYDRIGEVLRVVRSITPKPPLDVLVYTPLEFEQMMRESYFIKDEVAKKGRVLYE